MARATSFGALVLPNEDVPLDVFNVQSSRGS